MQVPSDSNSTWMSMAFDDLISRDRREEASAEMFPKSFTASVGKMRSARRVTWVLFHFRFGMVLVCYTHDTVSDNEI